MNGTAGSRLCGRLMKRLSDSLSDRREVVKVGVEFSAEKGILGDGCFNQITINIKVNPIR